MKCGRVILYLAVSALASQVPAGDLFDGFGSTWREQWHAKVLVKHRIVCVVENENGRLVLHTIGGTSQFALTRRLAINSPTEGRLRWHWKMDRTLPPNSGEKGRYRDGIAARVVVLFGQAAHPKRTRALHYGWAFELPAGTTFPSQESKEATIVVLRSGRADAGVWVSQERDVVADYVAFFGEAPSRILGLALVVGDDNTGFELSTWFANLSLDSIPSYGK